jgi:D-aspartate ligase
LIPFTAGHQRRIPAPIPSALVIGLDTVAGLQTSRILCRRGIRVVGIAGDGQHPACRTNTCARLLVAPTSGDGLLTALERLRHRDGGAVLFPCTDGSVSTIAHGPDDVRAFRSVLPSAEVVDTLRDRRRLDELMASLRLPSWPLRIVQDLGDARDAARALRFPCVVTPTDGNLPSGATARSWWTYDDARSWLEAAQGLLTRHPELRIAERPTDGGDTTYCCHVYIGTDGIPIVSFVARELRRWPPASGASSLSEAVHDDTVRDFALQVLSSVPFVGLGSVEVRRSATGVNQLLDVSVGRPHARSAIAEAGGVELLYTMYRDAIGAPLPADRRQHERPVKWIHLRSDVRAARYRLMNGELSPRGWIRSMKGPKVYAELDLADPLPSVVELGRRLRPFPAGRRRQSRVSGGAPA